MLKCQIVTLTVHTMQYCESIDIKCGLVMGNLIKTDLPTAVFFDVANEKDWSNVTQTSLEVCTFIFEHMVSAQASKPIIKVTLSMTLTTMYRKNPRYLRDLNPLTKTRSLFSYRDLKPSNLTFQNREQTWLKTGTKVTVTSETWLYTVQFVANNVEAGK